MTGRGGQPQASLACFELNQTAHTFKFIAFLNDEQRILLICITSMSHVQYNIILN